MPKKFARKENTQRRREKQKRATEQQPVKMPCLRNKAPRHVTDQRIYHVTRQQICHLTPQPICPKVLIPPNALTTVPFNTRLRLKDTMGCVSKILWSWIEKALNIPQDLQCTHERDWQQDWCYQPQTNHQHTRHCSSCMMHHPRPLSEVVLALKCWRQLAVSNTLSHWAAPTTATQRQQAFSDLVGTAPFQLIANQANHPCQAVRHPKSVLSYLAEHLRKNRYSRLCSGTTRTDSISNIMSPIWQIPPQHNKPHACSVVVL